MGGMLELHPWNDYCPVHGHLAEEQRRKEAERVAAGEEDEMSNLHIVSLEGLPQFRRDEDLED